MTSTKFFFPLLIYIYILVLLLLLTHFPGNLYSILLFLHLKIKPKKGIFNLLLYIM